MFDLEPVSVGYPLLLLLECLLSSVLDSYALVQSASGPEWLLSVRICYCLGGGFSSWMKSLVCQSLRFCKTLSAPQWLAACYLLLGYSFYFRHMLLLQFKCKEHHCQLYRRGCRGSLSARRQSANRLAGHEPFWKEQQYNLERDLPLHLDRCRLFLSPIPSSRHLRTTDTSLRTWSVSYLSLISQC